MLTNKLFKVSLVVCFLVGLVIYNSSIIRASDSINSFNSQIEIQQNGSIKIVEKLRYQTDEAKHGIFRQLPIRYQRGFFIDRMPIKDVEVVDDNHQPIPYEITESNNFVTLKIGDPNQTFMGDKFYQIGYTIERAVENRSVDGVMIPTLIWDVVGDGWQIPVLTSSAVIESPFAKVTKEACYSGAIGSSDNLCVIKNYDNKIVVAYDQSIDYNQNLTVSLNLDPQGKLLLPTKLQNWIRIMINNWFDLIIPIPFVIILIHWYKNGRDQIPLSSNVFDLDPNQAYKLKPLFYQARTPMMYEPIKQLTPGEAGWIYREKVTNQDVVAEILDLVRQKIIKIENVDKKDFRLTLIKQSPTGLPKVQKFLIDELFKASDSVTTKELKGIFYYQFEKAKGMISQAVVEKKLLTKSLTSSYGKGFLIWLIPFVMMQLIIYGITANINLTPWFVSGTVNIILGVIVLVNLPQKSVVGTNLSYQAKGLRQTIKLGEWREKIKEKNLFVEEVLPYAISLGVINELTKYMEKIGIKPPEYLGSYTNYALFNQSINAFSSSVTSNLSYNPSSSSYSSGGSSGGGGGGGGGGSW